jgi:hypothetical protein
MLSDAVGKTPSGKKKSICPTTTEGAMAEEFDDALWAAEALRVLLERIKRAIEAEYMAAAVRLQKWTP